MLYRDVIRKIAGVEVTPQPANRKHKFGRLDSFFDLGAADRAQVNL